MTIQGAAPVKVALVDDHQLFRKGMVELINDFEGYSVVWEASNGKEFTQKISPQNLPDVVLLDIRMPVMDGFETARWMEQRYPEVKILALSMHDDDETVIRMLKSGVNGYILKNADPSELRFALKKLQEEDCYFSGKITKILLSNIGSPSPKIEVELTEREIEFLKLVCTELPFKSFTPFLKINTRLVEDTREKLCKKLHISTRVGLAVYAIKHGIFKL